MNKHQNAALIPKNHIIALINKHKNTAAWYKYQIIAIIRKDQYTELLSERQKPPKNITSITKKRTQNQ